MDGNVTGMARVYYLPTPEDKGPTCIKDTIPTPPNPRHPRTISNQNKPDTPKFLEYEQHQGAQRRLPRDMARDAWSTFTRTNKWQQSLQQSQL